MEAGREECLPIFEAAYSVWPLAVKGTSSKSLDTLGTPEVLKDKSLLPSISCSTKCQLALLYTHASLDFDDQKFLAGLALPLILLQKTDTWFLSSSLCPDVL